MAACYLVSANISGVVLGRGTKKVEGSDNSLSFFFNFVFQNKTNQTPFAVLLKR